MRLAAGDRVALSRLADAAERAKCALSERSDFPVQLPYLATQDGRPVTLDTQLGRPEIAAAVEQLAEDALEIGAQLGQSSTYSASSGLSASLQCEHSEDLQ